MALFVSALELLLGAVACGVSNLLKAALCAVKGTAFLVLAPIASLLFLGCAGYAVCRGRAVQDFLDELREQSDSLERRRAFCQFEELLSAVVKALPHSAEIETDSSMDPLHDAEMVRVRSPRRRNRRRTA